MKTEKKCASCMASKPLREFWGKMYSDTKKSIPVLYVSLKCNTCAGIEITDDLTRARQLYYSYLESVILRTVGSRQDVCKEEHLMSKGGSLTMTTVKERLVRKGFNPSEAAVELTWYKLRTDLLRRRLKRLMARPEGGKRKAGRKPGHDRTDTRLWLRS
jgi:hypothetical protein